MHGIESNFGQSGQKILVLYETLIICKVESVEIELARSTDEEKKKQIKRLNEFKEKNKKVSKQALENLRKVVINNGNVFEELMTTVKYCSLGEITHTLFQVGGKYRRSM